MSIYKACDIRGDAATELSAERYRAWGETLGNLVPAGARFVVGGDVRNSTPPFRESLLRGLVAAGIRVLELGTLPTPMVYFAQRHLQAAGCATVTASHSPTGVNGLKWSLNGQPPNGRQVAMLRAAGEVIEPPFEEAAADRQAGSREPADVAGSYLDWLAGRGTAGSGPSPDNVVIDPGNGCWAGRCGPLLSRLFPSTRFHLIHDHADGNFPERDPDCAAPEHLEGLSATVRDLSADLGIAFDGDGDRGACCDGGGTVLTAEQVTWVLLHSFASELPGQTTVHDVKMSDLVLHTAGRLGARPVVERSGHAFIRARMLEAGARFGAELSGHYFYRELQGGDDGLFTACRLLDFLAAEQRTLRELRLACPPVFTTPDLRLPIHGDEQDRVIVAVRDSFSSHPQLFVDGVRIDFADGWGLIRKSVTEEAITCRFEGAGAAALDRIVDAFGVALGTHGAALLELYRARSVARDGD